MQTESESPVHGIAAAAKTLCEAMERAKNGSNSVVIDTLYGLITEAFCNYIEMLTTSPKASRDAYHARNILECLVWVRSCIADPKNAIQFNEDANRDMEGLNLALRKFATPVIGIPGALGAIHIEHMRDVLSREISDTAYKRVSDAAKEQSQGNFLVYEFFYKLLSKLAHPTALITRGNFRGEPGKLVSESCRVIATQLIVDLVAEIAGYLQPAFDIGATRQNAHAAIHDWWRAEKTKRKGA